MVLSQLPATHHIRWVARRKAEIVLAISGGLLTLDVACERYHISSQELMDWQFNYAAHGILGLRVIQRA
jgi:hypothetical protein